jgi:hypothetical protein
MSGSALDLAPTKKLMCQGAMGETPEWAIYRLDQALTKAGIDYHATPDDGRVAPVFTVFVRLKDAQQARVVLLKADRLHGSSGA